MFYNCCLHGTMCGNICFSGFYSDDLHVQGAEQGQRLSNVLIELQILRTLECPPTARPATWLDLENKSFAKNKKKYEFTILLLVIFQSCSNSLM